MAHFLQSLLEINDPLFAVGLNSLEKSTGNSGLDVRLVADLIEKTHKVMRKLGLDTKDTTAHELYSALLAGQKSGIIESILEDTDYVLCIVEGQIISLNLIDVIENFHHELSFSNRVYDHGQRSLRGEIVGRYLKHYRTNEATTIETAISIGLLNDTASWYNNSKHKHKK